jgi:hypothetical protein
MNCFKKPLLLSFLLLGLSGCGLPAGPAVPPSFATLPPRLLLSIGNNDSINPQIAVDSSNGVFVTWQDTTVSNQILFSSFTDGSSLPPPPVPVAIPGSAGGTFPRMTTDGNGNAYVIWYSNNTIFMNYGTSSGFQTTPVQISTPTVPIPQSVSPPPADIAYDPGTNTLYIVWSECSSMVCPSGSTFDVVYTTVTLSPFFVSTPPINVSNGALGTFSGNPKIVLSGGVPSIVYQTSATPSGLYLAIDSTTPYYPVGNLSQAFSESLGIDSTGSSYVAWESVNPILNGRDIYFNFLKAGDPSFNSQPLNLSNNGNSKGPVVAIDSSQYVYVAFFSRPFQQVTYDVFLTRTTNGGSIFTDAFDISNTLGDSFSYAPGIAISGKTGYIVWDDNTYTGSGNHQILLQKILLN